MITEVLSVGYFLRWAYNWIQSFAADIVATVEAAFTLSQIDVEDLDANQADMLQTKLINVTTATSSDAIPMIYTQYGLPSAITQVTLDANAYIKSICVAGPPGAKLSSVGHGDFCIDSNGDPTANSVCGISNPSAGVYSPKSVSVVDNIDGTISQLAGETLTLAGTLTATENYLICIVFMQPTSQTAKVVR